MCIRDIIIGVSSMYHIILLALYPGRQRLRDRPRVHRRAPARDPAPGHLRLPRAPAHRQDDLGPAREPALRTPATRSVFAELKAGEAVKALSALGMRTI